MTHTKDTREAIARIIDAYAWQGDSFAGRYARRETSLEKADAILAALEPAPAGGDVRELVEALSNFTVASQDEQGGCVYCGGVAPGSRFEADDTPESHDHDCPYMVAQRLLTATPAQPTGDMREKIDQRLKNKIVSAILSYPPDTMSKAEFMADEILAALTATSRSGDKP